MKLVPFNEDYVNCDQDGGGGGGGGGGGWLTATKQNLTGGMIIAVLMQFRKQKRRPKTKSPELQRNRPALQTSSKCGHFYGQFALSLGQESPQLILTLSMVPSVSI